MNLLSDLRFAARLLTKDPWFTAVAALTLALGIGANSTVFTLVNAVLIRGLPFEQPERIMQLSTRDARDRGRGVSYLDYKDWAASTRAFSTLSIMSGGTMNVSDEGRAPERYQGQFISHSLFGLIGTKPALGREFRPEDDQPGGDAVVLLSSGVWKNRYGGDPSILGKTIRINNVPSVVIGVMPEGFRFPNNAELWQPFAMVQGLAGQKRDARFFNVLGRLAPQATIEQARTDLSTITSRLASEYPDTNKDIRPFVERYTAGTGGPIRLMFLSLMGAVAFVLLIACANVANLLLARAAERTREISVRMSLGASRWQVVRQLLIESLMLATLGGVIGFGLSVVGVRLFDAAVSDPRLGKPYWIEFSMDWHVVGFFAAVCLLTAIAFGLAPALHISKTNVNEVLKEGGRGTGGSRRARRWTSVLLVTELALTLVLLAGAGFMMRSFLNMYRLDLGVTTAGVTTMRLQLPNQKYPTPETRLAFYQRLEDRLGAINSVPFVTVANNVPMGGGGTRLLAIEGRPAAAGETLPTIVAMLTGRTYFDLFDLPVRGRGFTDTDGAAGQDVAIVNERLASMQFPGEDPVGRRIRLTIPDDTTGAPPSPWLTIVGVTKNVRQRNPQNNPDPDPIVYRPFRADPIAGMALIVRTQGDPAAATALLREEVRALDADLPLFNIDTLDSILAVQRFFHRIFGTMFAIFAGIALVLSAVGLYAVTSYSVTQRTQEIGVRMALGAQAGQVLWLFLRQAFIKLAIGLAIGLAGAFGVGVLLRTMLVQTGSRDPVTLASIALVLAAVSIAACYWPARRATRLDPVTALRYE